MGTALNRQFLVDVIQRLDPSQDTSPGSPADIILIQPVLEKMGVDPLSTDVRTFILSRWLGEHPELDVLGAGSELADLLVGPLQLILEPMQREIRQVKLSQSFNDPDLLTLEEADALAANLVTPASYGEIAHQNIRVYFSTPRSVDIDSTISATSMSGLKYYASDSYSVTAEEMALNVDNGLYYIDIEFEAAEVGDHYNIAAHGITGIQGIPGVVKVANLYAFSSGEAPDTARGLRDRAEQAVGDRAPNTSGGISTLLAARLPSIQHVQVIGYGDPEMERDVLEGYVNLPTGAYGLGPISASGEGNIVQIDLNVLDAAGPALPNLEITDKTNLYSSEEVDWDLYLGDAITLQGIDYTLAEDLGAGLARTDCFTVAAKGKTGTVTPYVFSNGLRCIYSRQLEDSSADFLAAGIRAGDLLRVDGTWHPYGHPDDVSGPGNSAQEYFEIRSVSKTKLIVGPALIPEYYRFGSPEDTIPSGANVSDIGVITLAELAGQSDFYGPLPAEVGDFIALYDSDEVPAQEWEIIEVTSASYIRAALHISMVPITGTFIVGELLRKEGGIDVGTVVRVISAAGQEALIIAREGSVPWNDQLIEGVESLALATATRSGAPTVHEGYTVKWALRKGPEKDGYSRGSFLFGNPLYNGSIQYAVLSLRADVDVDTYPFLVPALASKEFTVRPKITTAGIEARVGLTISGVPAGVTSPNTPFGPIDVSAGTEVHIGGCTDAYIRQISQVESYYDITELRDESPLVPTWAQVQNSGYPDLTTKEGDNSVFVSSLFTGLTLDEYSVVVILEGTATGAYRVISHSGTEVRVDAALASPIEDGVHFYVTTMIGYRLDRPRITRVEEGTATTVIHSTDVTDLEADFVKAQVAVGDTFQVLEGSDYGTYTVTQVLSSTSLRLAGPLSASADGVNYTLYQAGTAMTLPLTRIKSVELLGSDGMGTGLVIPYADPVDIRSTELHNMGHGVKATGYGVVASSWKFSVVGADFDYSGIRYGDLLVIHSGVNAGTYTVLSASDDDIWIYGKPPLSQQFITPGLTQLAFTVGAPSVGKARLYFLEPTLCEVTNDTLFTTEDGKTYGPDFAMAHRHLRSVDELSDLQLLADVKRYTYSGLQGGEFVAGTLITSDGVLVGTLLEVYADTSTLYVLYTGPSEPGFGDPLEGEGGETATVASVTDLGVCLYTASLDLALETVEPDDKLTILTGVLSGDDIDNVNSIPVQGKTLHLTVDGVPTSVTFSGSGALKLSQAGIPGGVVQQINAALEDVVATVSGSKLLLHSEYPLSIVSDFLGLGLTTGYTNVTDNADDYFIYSVLTTHLAQLKTYPVMGVATVTTEGFLKGDFYRLGVQRIGPKEMALNIENGLYYFDVEIRSTATGDLYNLPDDAKLAVSGHRSLGYRLTTEKSIFTFSPLEEVTLELSPVILDVLLDDEPGNLEPLPTKDLRITYDHPDVVATAQNLLAQGKNRVVNNNPLARHARPVYVRGDISYYGGSNETIVKRDVVDLVNGTLPSTELEVHDVYSILTRRGATRVTSPIELIGVRHNTDRTLDTVRSKDRLTVGRTSHLIADEDNLDVSQG